MKRALGIAGSVAVVAALAAGVRIVRAGETDAGRGPRVDITASATDEERALLGEIDQQKWIPARERAQKILAAQPDSFIATWALANVHHQDEGNHARALYLLHKAERQLLARGHDAKFHKKLLEEEASLLGEMDRSTEQIETFDRLALLYPPGSPDRKLWPLVKLGRYDEAKALAESLLDSDNELERQRAHAALMNIAEERHDREAMYQYARAAVERFPNSCITQRNAGVIAWERFKPEQAETWLLGGAKASEDDCAVSPYRDAAWLYLLAGDFQQAVSASKSANGRAIGKQYRAHYALEHRAMLADLTYALGKPEEASRFATEVYEQPERTGMTSNSAATARLVRTLRYWLALDSRLIFERERASYRGFASGAGTRARIAFARLEARRAMFQLATDSKALITITRPNLGDTHVARWTIGGLIEILGPGVMKTAVAEARERDAQYPEAAPYLDALEGEIAFRTGDLSRALELGKQAVAGVPLRDGLIRWYTMAWMADARRRQGDAEGAAAAYHEVLQKLPSALRILDLALPVTISNDGSERAREVASKMSSSPRFTESDGGMRIEVAAQGSTVNVCLVDPRGFQFACVASEGSVEDILDAFHAAAFSPKVAMTQADLRGLDGSTSSRSADSALEELIK